LEIRN